MINHFENVGEKIANVIAKMLVKAAIKPIFVTIFRFIITIPISWYFFSRGKYIYNIIGLLLYISLAILDWVDGEMARLYKLPKETAPFGRLIDHTSDRVLMLTVLGSIFYAGMNSPDKNAWIILAVLYYSTFFFSTTIHYEFNNTFGLDFERYSGIEKQMNQISLHHSLSDRILLNLICVHNNSFTKFCFSVSYPLLIGIITNQLIPAFIFITIMYIIRSLGLFIIMYKALKVGKTDSTLVKVLRKNKV